MVVEGGEWDPRDLWYSWKVLERLRDAWRALTQPAIPETTEELDVGSVSETRSRKILIVGCGGAGKTTLLQLMCSGPDFLFNVPTDYVESISVETIDWPHGPGTELVALPGQRHRFDRDFAEYAPRIEAGEFRGVICVSSFGYHAVGQVRKDELRDYRPKMSRSALLTEFTTVQREAELRLLRALAGSMSRVRKPVWMLSLVTKEDLWFKSTKSVREHYEEGEHRQIINEIAKHRAPEEFRHELAYVSLLIRNLETGKGDLLANTVSGYDQKKQSESIRRLMQVIDGLREWEEERT